MDDYKPPEGYRPKYVKILAGEGEAKTVEVQSSNENQVKHGILEVLRNEQSNKNKNNSQSNNHQ
jgi:hypothetical protein